MWRLKPRPLYGTIILLVAFCFAAGLASVASADSWTATFGVSPYAESTYNASTPPYTGPWSGPISSIAVDPANDAHVIVASEKGGVFETSDSGSTWQHADLTVTFVRDVAFLPVSSLGPGRPCPCAIATGGSYYETPAGGGAYIAYTSGGRLTRWRAQAGVVPAAGGCTAPQGQGISIAPDTHEIYVATSCGLAVGTPQGSFSNTTVPGAANQDWHSVVALGQGHVILAGSAGVYTFDGAATWSASSPSLPPTTGVHSLSADPRGGGRAYYVDDNTNLWEQNSVGSWSAVPAPPIPMAGCGGIPYVHAIQPPSLLNAFRLYYGDRCFTWVVAVDDSVEPSAVVGAASWVGLQGAHPDTRDLVFHNGTEDPYLISSDGGIARAVDRTTFMSVGGPDKGLNALEATDIVGQYVNGSGPDLYYATWHDFVWAMHGTTPNPAGFNQWEGWGLGVQRIVPPHSPPPRISFTNQAAPAISGRYLAVGTAMFWPQPAGAIGSPTFLSPGRFVEGVNDGPGHEWDISYNDRAGAASRWRVIASVGRPFQGQPIVAGPESNPTLVQPYLDGTVADSTSPDYGKDVVHLVSLSGFSGGGMAHLHWPLLGPPRLRHSLSIGLGGLGGYDITGGEYWALGVDPVDPTRMIAPDVINGAMKMTIDGGDSWSTIPGLARLITRGGVFSFSVPLYNGLAPLASVVSFCPDNDSRVLVATRQTGDYFSADGGATWVAIPNSDSIVSATSVFWLRGCDGAYVSSDGRGIWRIDTNVRAVLSTCAPSVCSAVSRLRSYLQAHHRDVRSLGITTVDGYITSVKTRGRHTTVIVTPGTAVGFYPRRSRSLSVAYTGPFVHHKRYAVALLMLGKRHVLLSSSRPLRLHPMPKGRLGHGLGHPHNSPLGSITILGAPLTAAGGVAAVQANGPLVVSGGPSRRGTAKLQVRVDGVPDVTLPGGTRQFKTTVENHVMQALGLHAINLVSLTRKRPLVLASATFEVVNADAEDVSPSRLPVTLGIKCPSAATSKVPIKIGGVLTPWLQGSAITVTYTSSAGTAVHSALVAPNGSFSDTFTPTAPGVLAIDASWPGNPEYLPTSASSCQVKVS